MGKQLAAWQEPANIAIIKGMLLRGDKQSDIAARFACNAGRIAEINTGKRGLGIAAATENLPPPGPVGHPAPPVDAVMVALRSAKLLLRAYLDLAVEVRAGGDTYDRIRDGLAACKSALAIRQGELTDG